MKKLLFSVLLLLTMAFGAVAQTEVAIGNGSDSYHAFPVNMFYNYSLTQQIYTADEIGMSGTITSISFYYDYSEDFNLPDINMYMMNTTKSAFNGYDDVVAVNDASLVYSGDFVGSEPGWITINLDNEFYYNGTDNLLICIYDSVYGYPGPDFTFKYSQTSDYTVLSFYSDYQVPDLGNLSSFSDNMEANMCHSNIKLVFETEENPACPKVRQITVNNITSSTAEVSWSPRGSETAWLLKYGEEGFEVETEGTTVEATSTNITLANLEARTIYDVYVKAVCGDDNVSGWRMLAFETECEAIAEFPWTEDFESVTDLNFPQCWFSINNNYDDEYWYLSDDGDDNKEVAIYTDYHDGDNDDYLILPPFELDGSYGLSFDVRVESTNEPNDYEVLLSTTSSNIEDFTVVLQGLESVSNTEYQRKNIPVSNYHGVVYIAIHVPQGGLDGWYLYMDNFELRNGLNEAEILDFNFPTRLAAPIIDSENATINTIASYQTDLDNLGESLTLSVDAIYELNSIITSENEKIYSYTVTAEDRTTTKDWSVVVTKAEAASTANDILSFTFEYQVGESVIDTVNKTVSAYVEWYYDLENNTIAPNIEISPMATITPESGVYLYFDEPVEYTVVAEDGESTALWTVTIIQDPNACVNPYYLDVYDIEETTATLQWWQMYNETSYLVKISTTEMDDMTATADVYDNEVVLTSDEVVLELTELTASTAYYVYVQSNCGTDEWVKTFFMTECSSSAYSLPFVETFDATSASRKCWTIVDANNDNTTWDYDYMITGNQESAYYQYNRNNAANDWLISPKITIVENAFLTFDYAVNSNTISERFSVYVMDDPENYESATQILATQTVYNDEFVAITDIDLSGYAGQDIYIGIKCESEADHYSFIVDNFKLLLPSYTITATAGENGTISPAEVTVYQGEDADFTIVANEGYRIESVMVDATNNVTENVVAGDGVFFYTFENVTEDHTINVTFEEIPTYTITVEAGENGTVLYNDALVSEPLTVYEGDTPEFVITPATGYQIDVLTVGGDTIELTAQQLGGLTYTFEPVMADITLAVTFEAVPPTTHTITLTVGEHGTVTPSGENGVVIVNDGADISFTITPDEGYEIGGLFVDDSPLYCDVTGETYTFRSVTTDHTLSVTFIAVVSADEIEAGSMSIYPNPNNGMFSIDFSNIDGEATYQLIDARGVVVETRDINVMNGETIDFNYNLRAGAYFVRIINGDKVYVEQIVVE